jgi:N-hydroxyarylamine O-acetyltransferase
MDQSVIAYLNYLQLPLEKPTYHYLERLCTAQLDTFPFENISKLLDVQEGKGGEIVSFESFVTRYEKHHYGGTCYTLNANFMRLLRKLGFYCYHVMLGKEHMAIVVVIDNERFYVDCGAAAPFFKPVKLMGLETKVSSFGDDNVQLVFVRSDTYNYIRFIQGEQSGKVWPFDLLQQYDVQDFIPASQTSIMPNSPFMKILRCQKWQTDKGRSVSLRNNTFTIRYASGEVINKMLTSTAEIGEVIAEEFSLPKLPVAKAIDVLEKAGINIFSHMHS